MFLDASGKLPTGVQSAERVYETGSPLFKSGKIVPIHPLPQQHAML
jgi:hypothetical protein